jgi:hypothetical protein
MLRTIGVCLLSLLIPAFVHAGQQSNIRERRVRPLDTRSANLLEEGIERSATIRNLVGEIQTSDLIVYIGINPVIKRDIVGSLRFVTLAGSLRLLHISLNPSVSTPVLLRTLGHELQHAIEVAGAPEVIDEQSLGAFYRRIGITSHDHERLDTLAAQRVGEIVRGELHAASPGTASRAFGGQDPEAAPRPRSRSVAR